MLPRKKAAARPAPKITEASLDERVEGAIAWLKSHATRATRDGMAR